MLRRKSQASHAGGNSSSATPLGIWAVIVSRGRAYAVERARNNHLTPNGLYRIRANAVLRRICATMPVKPPVRGIEGGSTKLARPTPTIRP